MKRLYIIISTISIFLLFFSSCYYDNEEALYPTLNSSCDSTNVTYSGTILPVLINNCYSCHSDANVAFGGNVHLESIADVRTNSGKLIVSIRQTGPIPMPPVGKIKDCSIKQFDIWVRNGMPGN